MDTYNNNYQDSTINDNINETNEIEDDFFKDVFGDDINKVNRNEIEEYLQQPVELIHYSPIKKYCPLYV